VITKFLAHYQFYRRRPYPFSRFQAFLTAFNRAIG